MELLSYKILIFINISSTLSYYKKKKKVSENKKWWKIRENKQLLALCFPPLFSVLQENAEAEQKASDMENLYFSNGN